MRILDIIAFRSRPSFNLLQQRSHLSGGLQNSCVLPAFRRCFEMATKSIQLRIDEGLKDRAESVLEELGLDMPTALRLFLKKVVNTRAIPFRVSVEEEAGFSQAQVREILASREEARAGAGLSGPFRSPEETQGFLDSLKGK